MSRLKSSSGRSGNPLALMALAAAALVVAGCGGGGGVSGPSDVPTPAPAPTPAPTPTPAATARYRVTFEATWSAATHPDRFPRGPHFSPLIGGTHDATVRFWDVGRLATEGVRLMAQEGSQTPLDVEVMAAIDARTAEHVLRGGGINPSPGGRSLEFEISRSYPLVTLVSMIAPSPDWFVGVSGLSLLEGDWIAQRQVVLFPYDAGTDDGAIYTSPDVPADPRQPVSRIEGPPFLVDGQVPPLGTFTFTRLSP